MYNSIHYVDPSGYIFGIDDLIFWIVAVVVTAGVTYATWPDSEAGSSGSVGRGAGFYTISPPLQAIMDGWRNRVPESVGAVQQFGTQTLKQVERVQEVSEEARALAQDLGVAAGTAANAILTTITNTITRPGYNYGLYLADLNAGRGVLNWNYFGASLDSAWFIASGGSAIGAARAAMSPATSLLVSQTAASSVVPKQITVIGSRADTLAYRGRPGYNVLDIPDADWSPKVNIKWLDSALRRGDTIRLVTSPSEWFKTRPQSAYFLELKYLAWKLKGLIDYGQ